MQYKMQVKAAIFNEGMIDFKERFFVTFQQLQPKDGLLDSKMLASNHSYLVYTPLGIFLWHGSHVDLPRQRGSLQILKTFYNQHLNESFNYMPGYLYDQSGPSDHCFRVET